MNGSIQSLNIGPYECMLYLPEEYNTYGKNYPVVYINGEDNIQEIMSGIEPHFGVECKAFIIISIQSKNWEDDFTPWPSPALTKKSDPFGGYASNYLQLLVNTIKPFIDSHYRTKPDPENTALIGYSLGGLAALYGLYTMDIFGKFGSMSGSLWYDGWVEFMGSNIPVNTGAKVYISLGRGEEHSRNMRMARVGDCTRRAASILESQLESKGNLMLEWNNGGHFTEIPERFMRAILWLMKKDRDI